MEGCEDDDVAKDIVLDAVVLLLLRVKRDGWALEERVRWISMTGILLSEGVGLSAFPGMALCERRVSISFFLKRGTRRLVRTSGFHSLEAESNGEGKQVHGDGRLGRLEFEI